MGLVFILLLGEIDLSAGLHRRHVGRRAGDRADPPGPALAGRGARRPGHGARIGFCIGILVARLGIPSFVVTLAAFLGLQGVLLKLIGEGGTIPNARRDPARA